MTNPVAAVAQTSETDEWKEPAPEVPMDHEPLVTTALPLLGIAFYFGLVLVRSMP